jgi:ubiquinone biosynthesis protein
VVVKVQRPHIRTEMKADLGIMQNAAKVVSARSEQVRAIDLVGMLEQFSTSVLAELDYTGEAFNAFKLAKNMEGLPGVHVPTIYPELSTSRVLTLEFIHGVKANNIEAIEKTDLDRSELARNALRAFVKQLLIDGFFHADPHPGNVLIDLQTGVITFIDTGMVGELDVQQHDVLAMAQVLKNLSTPFRGPVDEKAYYKDFERKVGRLMYMGASLDFGQVVNSGLNLLREHGLRLDPNLTMAIKALMQAEAIATLLYPEGGIVADGVQMVREELMQVVTADRMLEEGKKQLTAIARDALQQVPSLSVATASWLNQYRKGRFEVYVDTSALAKEVNKISNFGRQAVIAIILVGMIIGSAIATSVAATAPAEGDIWNIITRLAYLGYIFAMVIAMVIVLRLVWRWLKGKSADED